jgi:putative membrane protein
VIKTLSKHGISAAWQQVNGSFLFAVLSGILISIFSLARLISWLLTNYQMFVWAFFFGLIIGSAIFVARKISTWNFFTILMLLLGSIIAWYITIASPSTTSEALWFVFLSGAVAICAMILPGISGSFILLLMGKYEFILQAVKSINIPVLLSFAFGCLVGIISFSHVIAWLFKKYPNATLALLSGFMIGSLNKLWPWKEVVEFRLSSHGDMVPFIEKSISPNSWALINGQNPMILYVSLFILAGLGLIMLFERLNKPATKIQ